MNHNKKAYTYLRKDQNLQNVNGMSYSKIEIVMLLLVGKVRNKDKFQLALEARYFKSILVL